MNNMLAKSYNRTIRAHKQTYEALWKVFWPTLLHWTKEHGMEDSRIMELATQLKMTMVQSADSSDSPDSCEVLAELEKVLQLLEEFDHMLPPTSAYWRQYMNIGPILLQCIRSNRTGN